MVAADANQTLEQIRQLNSLSSDVIYVGQRLVIDQNAAAPAAEEPEEEATEEPASEQPEEGGEGDTGDEVAEAPPAEEEEPALPEGSSDSTGTKASEKDPSANRRRMKLGILKATKKASAPLPAPSSDAMVTSRASPSTRDSIAEFLTQRSGAQVGAQVGGKTGEQRQLAQGKRDAGASASKKADTDPRAVFADWLIQPKPAPTTRPKAATPRSAPTC